MYGRGGGVSDLWLLKPQNFSISSLTICLLSLTADKQRELAGRSASLHSVSFYRWHTAKDRLQRKVGNSHPWSCPLHSILAAVLD